MPTFRIVRPDCDDPSTYRRGYDRDPEGTLDRLEARLRRARDL